METAIGLCIGAVLFFCTMTAYITGIRHGKLIQQGNVPKVELNPVKAAVKAVEYHEQKKEEQKLTDELTEVFNYSKETAMEAMKKEKAR